MSKVIVRKGGDRIVLDINKVKYLEAYGDYVKIHTVDKRYVINNTMTRLTEQLELTRVSRSYSVNLDFVEEYNKDEITNLKIRIGRGYANDFYKAMESRYKCIN